MAKDEAHAERARAYTSATSALRSAHADEFRALLAKEYEARGLDVKVRPSVEELQARADAKAAEKAQRAADRHAAKVARAEAALAALKGEAPVEAVSA